MARLGEAKNTHDRYFISKTANKIWNIEDAKIKEFNGGYDEWHTWYDERAMMQQASKKKETGNKQQTTITEPQKKEATPKQANTNELQQLKRELQNKSKSLQKLEAELEKMKTELAAIEIQLSDPSVYADKEKFLKLDEQYKQLQHKVATKNKDYERLLEEVMELEEKIA